MVLASPPMATKGLVASGDAFVHVGGARPLLPRLVLAILTPFIFGTMSCRLFRLGTPRGVKDD
jgi:hypothetical protein